MIELSRRDGAVAGPIHTVVVLAALAVWVLGPQVFGRPLTRLGPRPADLYLLTAATEWLVVGVISLGIWYSGAPFSAIFGDRWRSWGQLLRDIAVAAAFWIAALLLLWLLSLAWRFAPTRNLQPLLPQGRTDLILWVGLSISAGVCEEAIFRGYLQRQFIALTRSAPAGIALSAALFGAAHAYQGARMILPLGFYGAMFGVLAYWRRNVRPGMIAHAWHDALFGVAVSLMRH